MVQSLLARMLSDAALRYFGPSARRPCAFRILPDRVLAICPDVSAGSAGRGEIWAAAGRHLPFMPMA